MKTIAISGLAILACLLGASGAAQAQPREYRYAPQDGGPSPASTLRITEQPQAGPSGVVIRDTPENLAQYRQCRDQVDREAVDDAQLRAGVAECLKALEARRGM